MIVGVTGSRYPRPVRSVDRLRVLLLEWGATELHQGDCSGWDEQAFEVARALGLKTVAHPPTNDSFRAFTASDVILPPAPYLDRNKTIVRAVDRMIAAPDGPERQRSGTWSTVRFAKSQGVKGLVLSWQ
ncbi:MAG: hypothetical protein ABJN39_09190 [Sulfitobacter sp.]|uniref:hypothetical protein n=1 Tax=unclassified Sulfitobacter TaxID=196795 RepID=UPI002942C142|nr:hypothetical protein [Sulfitobacter sp. LC.270.F.C4]WOI13548.1 hypothetical protein R1T45_01590 [Sulfitobacter sp. LC.270.F.C4]